MPRNTRVRPSHNGYVDICALYYNTAPLPVHFRAGESKRRYLPQVRLDSHTILRSLCYTTTLKQVFSNSSEDTIPQARYTFPLYDGVAVSGYTITYGDTTLRGIVQQKDVAKKTYEAAFAMGETAGLLESLPAGLFAVTLGNLPPNTDVHVSIVYCGELKHDAGIDGLRFMLPTSVAPRYGDYPGEVLKSTAISNGGISITVDVDMGKSVIRKLQSPSHPIAVSMGATSSDAAQATFTPSKASTTLTLGTTELADDFIVQLLIDDISKPQVFVEKHPNLHTRAVVATLVPKSNLPTSHPEIVFIADQSGSMQGSKNDALVSALMVFVKSLPLGVRFNIIAFGSSFKALWPKSQAYNEASMKAALDFVGTFSADYGGTELLLPVKAAFEQMLGDIPLEVMMLTDGEIWGEQMLFEYINAQITEKGTDARVFALGIGNDVSHTLVEGVARAGRGFAQFVAEGENTDRKVVRMLKGALYPHLTGRKIEVRYSKSETVQDDDFELVEKVDYCLNIKDSHDGSVPSTAAGKHEKPMSFFDTTADLDKPIQPAGLDRYAHLPKLDTPKVLQAPSEVPSLFPFNRTTIYLLLGPDAPQGPISSIILRAISPQGPLELTIDVDEKEVVGTTVHQLAAKKAIHELEEGRGWLRSAKTSTGFLIKDEHKSRFDELVEREAVRLGESFQVASKWTSFVAVDANDSSRVQEEPAQPARADRDAMFSMMSHQACMPVPPAQMQVDHMRISAAPLLRMSSLSSHAPPPARSCSAFGSSAAAPPPPAPGGYTANRYAPSAGGSGSALFGSAPAAPAAGSAFGPQAHISARTGPATSHGPGVGLQHQSSWVPMANKSSGANSIPSPFGANIGATSTKIEKTREEKEDDSDDDMGYALFDGAPAARKAATPISPLHRLISLQIFSGAWEWSDALLAVVMLKGKKLEFDAAFGSEQVMATSLAVAYMEARLNDSKDVWEMVVEKAKVWMGSQVGADGVDGFVEKAKGLI